MLVGEFFPTSSSNNIIVIIYYCHATKTIYNLLEIFNYYKSLKQITTAELFREKLKISFLKDHTLKLLLEKTIFLIFKKCISNYNMVSSL